MITRRQETGEPMKQAPDFSEELGRRGAAVARPPRLPDATDDDARIERIAKKFGYGRPTEEEAEKGFADLRKRIGLPSARYVAASAFAVPAYYCGGDLGSVAEAYVSGHLGGSAKAQQERLASAGGWLPFFVDIRHEKLDEWQTIRVVTQLQVQINAEGPDP